MVWPDAVPGQVLRVVGRLVRPVAEILPGAARRVAARVGPELERSTLAPRVGGVAVEVLVGQNPERVGAGIIAGHAQRFGRIDRNRHRRQRGPQSRARMEWTKGSATAKAPIPTRLAEATFGVAR